MVNVKVQFSDHQEENFDNNSLSDKVQKLNIEFYSNDRCGFCHRSKELFEREGVIEYMTIKNNQPLPEGVEGYPHFVSKKLVVNPIQEHQVLLNHY